MILRSYKDYEDKFKNEAMRNKVENYNMEKNLNNNMNNNMNNKTPIKNPIKKLIVRIFTRNSSDIIWHTLDYYSKWTNDITVIDNYSDDNTREIVKNFGFKIENDKSKGMLDDLKLVAQKNNCITCTQGRDVAVIIVDADEILYLDGKNPIDVLNYIAQFGYGVIKPKGYNIVSDKLPTIGQYLLDQEDFKFGYRDEMYDKTVLYRTPAKMNWQPGCHVSNPTLPVYIDAPDFNDNFKLLHFREIGGVQNLINRYKRNQSTQTQSNLNRNFSNHYGMTEDMIIQNWNNNLNKLEVVLDKFKVNVEDKIDVDLDVDSNVNVNVDV